MTLEWWEKMREYAKGWYVLENGKIRPAKDLIEASAQLSDITTRRVDFTELENCTVSTVFLGLDHNLSGKGTPILFETLIQGGEYDGCQWRYAAMGQAKKAHREIVDALQAGEEPCPTVGEEVWIWKMLEEMFEEDNSGEEWKNE